MNEFGSLPLRAFSPKFGRGPFAYGMTLHKGGNVFEDVGSEVSNAGQSIANVVSDAGTTIDKAVIQPALQDPAGTIIKIAAIAAAPATGGTSLYAIPAYTAAKATAAGLPIEDVAFMTAVSAAATAAGVSVADYVGTMAEYGTDLGSQQTAMLAAQNAGIGTGEVASTALGQTVGGAAAGGIAAAANDKPIDLGLLSGATSGAIGAGVGATVDAAANSGLFNNVVSQANTGNTNMEDWLTASGYYDNPANVNTYTPPTAADFSPIDYGQNSGDVEAQAGGYYGGAAPVNPYTNMSDEQIAAELAKTPAFVGSGTDSNTILGMVKSLGSSVVKALLGGTATAAQRAAAQNSGFGNLLGAATGLFTANQNKAALQNSYNTQAQSIRNAATQAQNLASFTPIGTTNFFGSSQFTRDPVTGQITSAGFTPTAQVGGQIQNLFGLGAQALPTTTNTQDIQRQYIAQQQGLLAPGREQALANLNNTQFQTGTTGLATGGTMAGYAPGQAGLMQTNPQLAAYYNSLAQQDAQLAANAPTYAQNLLNSQINTGTGLFGSANTLQGYAQQPLTTSTDLAKAQAAAGASAGQLGLTGQTNAAQLAATGMLQGNAAMQGTYNQLGQTATGIGNTIANWLS
jgi:hypothetical protein